MLIVVMLSVVASFKSYNERKAQMVWNINENLSKTFWSNCPRQCLIKIDGLQGTFLTDYFYQNNLTEKSHLPTFWPLWACPGACIIKLITALIYGFLNKLDCFSLASLSSLV
jgi:hypothetical protein